MMRSGEAYGFGDDVVISAEVVRVLGKMTEDGTEFMHMNSRRDFGRFVHHHFGDLTTWPGEPVGLDWEPAPTGLFQPEPTLEHGVAFIRCRRLLYRTPEIGIVLGHSRRQEGRLLPGAGDGNPGATLAGPGRKMRLVEVALRGATRSRIVLAHPHDLAQLRRPHVVRTTA